MSANEAPEERQLQSRRLHDRGGIPQWLFTELRRIEANDSTHTDLNVRYRYIGTGGSYAIRRALKKTRTLKSITVGGVDPEPARKILEGICKNSSLREVHVELFSNDPTNDDVPYLLGKKLKSRESNLVILRLFWGRIGTRGLRSIARGLVVNTTLAVLNLGHNSLGNAGTIRLCRALERNSTLQGVYLQHNGIGHEGGLAIAQVLKQNTSIETMSLDGNDLGTDAVSEFGNVLQRENTTLKFLYVNDEQSYKHITIQIGFWCALNRAHRKHAWDEQLPQAMWSAILAQVRDRPSLLYGLLREKPDLFLNASGSLKRQWNNRDESQ